MTSIRLPPYFFAKPVDKDKDEVNDKIKKLEDDVKLLKEENITLNQKLENLEKDIKERLTVLECAPPGQGGPHYESTKASFEKEQEQEREKKRKCSKD